MVVAIQLGQTPIEAKTHLQLNTCYLANWKIFEEKKKFTGEISFLLTVMFAYVLISKILWNSWLARIASLTIQSLALSPGQWLRPGSSLVQSTCQLRSTTESLREIAAPALSQPYRQVWSNYLKAAFYPAYRMGGNCFCASFTINWFWLLMCEMEFQSSS